MKNIFRRKKKQKAQPPPADRSIISSTHVQRDFDAADMSRLFADWSGDFGVTSEALRAQLPRILMRVRERAKNDAYMRRFLGLFKTNVVGPDGFKLKMDVISEDGVDANGQPRSDTNANMILKRDFNKWAEEPKWVDAAKKKNLTDMTALVANYWARDGEAIVRMLPGFGWPDNPFAFSMKVYRPDILDKNLNQKLDNGNQIVLGVENDSWGAAVAYHFIGSYDPYLNMQTAFSRNHIRIPADQIIHLFLEEEEDQVRGTPMAGAVLTNMRMADGYDEAELVAARDAACSMGTYQTQGGEEPVPRKKIGSDIVLDKEPGQRQILPEGWEFKDHIPNRPNDAFADFKKAVLRKIAGGLLVNYNTFANDLEGVNYSSLREGKLTEQDFWKCFQAFLSARFLRKMFREGWLPMYLSTGMSDLPISKMEKFKRDKWLGKRWQWVDPQREAKGAAIDVEHGWKTDTEITADRGGDFEENVRITTHEAEITKGTPLEKTSQSEEAA
jgi:lambda family phage portal protein